MKKTLYSIAQRDHGFFDSSNFGKFLAGYKAAKQVTAVRVNDYRKDSTTTEDVMVYHIEPQGVTLFHSQDEQGTVWVNLFGKKWNWGS